MSAFNNGGLPVGFMLFRTDSIGVSNAEAAGGFSTRSCLLLPVISDADSETGLERTMPAKTIANKRIEAPTIVRKAGAES